MKTKTGFNIVRLPNIFNHKSTNTDYYIKDMLRVLGRYYPENMETATPESVLSGFDEMCSFIAENWCTVFMCIEGDYKFRDRFGFSYTCSDMEKDMSKLIDFVVGIKNKVIKISKEFISFLCISYDGDDIRYYNSCYKRVDITLKDLGEYLGIDYFDDLELNPLQTFISNCNLDVRLNPRRARELTSLVEMYGIDDLGLVTTGAYPDYDIVAFTEGFYYYNIYDRAKKKCLLPMWYHDISRYNDSKYFIIYDKVDNNSYTELLYLYNAETNETLFKDKPFTDVHALIRKIKTLP